MTLGIEPDWLQKHIRMYGREAVPSAIAAAAAVEAIAWAAYCKAWPEAMPSSTAYMQANWPAPSQEYWIAPNGTKVYHDIFVWGEPKP